jgi:hypothetical protein
MRSEYPHMTGPRLYGTYDGAAACGVATRGPYGVPATPRTLERAVLRMLRNDARIRTSDNARRELNFADSARRRPVPWRA